MGGENTVFEGIIAKGLGEGAFFMGMEHYRKEIKKKLGFEAYKGTLNIKPQKNFALENKNRIKISGFEKSGRKFGGASCYRAKISHIGGAIIIPDINKHKEVIEFIAPVHLKSKLNIKDGDKVIINLI